MTTLPNATGAAASRRGALKGLAGLGAFAAATASPAARAQAAPIRWRMGTSWPTSLPLLHEAALDFAQSVQAASGGRMEIEVVDPSKHGAPAGLPDRYHTVVETAGSPRY